MNIFLETVLWLAIFSASFSIFCMAISFGQYFARKSKIFEPYIKNGWIALNENKFFEQYIKNGWIARNFDWIAIVMLSIFVLGVLVYSAELLDLINSKIKKYDTIRQYVFNNPSELVALLIFLILLMRRWIARNFDITALLVSASLLIWFFDPSSDEMTIRSFIEEYTLFAGTLLGFPILIKRFDEMRLQTRVSQENLKETQKQSRTSQYRDARDLLQSNQLNSRMIGIAGLWRFANTHPQEEYHNVMDVFTQFIKYSAPYEWEEGTKKETKKAGKRADIIAILEHMVKRSVAGAAPYYIDLRDANLDGADLSGAALKGSDLSRANLERSDLSHANLDGADLSDANLERSNLFRANLKGSDLSCANLEGAYLFHANLDGADLSGAALEGSNLSDANLERANLSDASLDGANLGLTIINGTNFTDAVDLMQEQIDGCVFITDHPRYEQSPSLPDDIGHRYQKMSIIEWEAASGRKFYTHEIILSGW